MRSRTAGLYIEVAIPATHDTTRLQRTAPQIRMELLTWQMASFNISGKLSTAAALEGRLYIGALLLLDNTITRTMVKADANLPRCGTARYSHQLHRSDMYYRTISTSKSGLRTRLLLHNDSRTLGVGEYWGPGRLVGGNPTAINDCLRHIVRMLLSRLCRLD
jgi:hypothetical protein